MNDKDEELDEYNEELISCLDVWAEEHGKTVPSPCIVRALIFKAIDVAYSCAPTHYSAMISINANLTDAIIAYQEAFDSHIEGP